MLGRDIGSATQRLQGAGILRKVRGTVRFLISCAAAKLHKINQGDLDEDEQMVVDAGDLGRQFSTK